MQIAIDDQLDDRSSNKAVSFDDDCSVAAPSDQSIGESSAMKQAESDKLVQRLKEPDVELRAALADPAAADCSGLFFRSGSSSGSTRKRKHNHDQLDWASSAAARKRMQ